MSCQLHRLGRRAQDTEPWCSKTQGPQPQDTNLGAYQLQGPQPQDTNLGAHQPEGPRVPTQLLGLPKGENSSNHYHHGSFYLFQETTLP